MEKQKIIIPQNLYKLDYKNNNYYIYSEFYSELLKKMLNSDNFNILLNFEDKKDKRRDDTKDWANIILNFSNIYSKENITSDFTFNQNPLSQSTFDLEFGKKYVYMEYDNKINDTLFNFNGSFGNIKINPNSQFKNYVFNFNSKLNKDVKIMLYHNVNIYNDNNINSIKINNDKYKIMLKNINAKNLKEIAVTNSNVVEINLNDFETKNLKKLDLRNNKYISIKSNIIFNYDDMSSKDYEKVFAKKIPLDTEVLLSPETTIDWDWTYLKHHSSIIGKMNNEEIKISDIIKTKQSPISLKVSEIYKFVYNEMIKEKENKIK